MKPQVAAHPLPLVSALGLRILRRKTRDILYCSVSERLMEYALAIVSAVVQLHKRDSIDEAGPVRCNVRYRSARFAAKNCLTLQLFRRQRAPDERSAVDAQPGLVDSSGLRLQCTLEDLLPYGDFRSLAKDVAESEVGTTIVVEKRLKNVAATYNQLFDPSLVVGITIDAGHNGKVARNETGSWMRRVVVEHQGMVDFLRLFVSLCSSEKPPENFTVHPLHTVEIVDLSTIIVDGVRVHFNAPRRAALFTLAVTGTETVPVEVFARLYDNYLTGNTEVANYWKIFTQAMQGLQKSLPFLRVVRVRPNHRTIFGLSIRSAVVRRHLEEWLGGRRQKVDPALQVQNS